VTTHTALVIGGGLVGLETADFLAERGIRVTLVEMRESVGSEMDPLARSMLLGRLREHGVELRPSTRVLHLEAGQVVAAENDDVRRWPIETVVLAVGARPERELADALEAAGIPFHMVGDALEPRGAGEAIREGFEVAARL
jgi:NADPH-dependent 2,4-dienoyl-CoA reductase/sulfur reductase-like enzyme